MVEMGPDAKVSRMKRISPRLAHSHATSLANPKRLGLNEIVAYVVPKTSRGPLRLLFQKTLCFSKKRD
jgi:hypothetical protein